MKEAKETRGRCVAPTLFILIALFFPHSSCTDNLDNGNHDKDKDLDSDILQDGDADKESNGCSPTNSEAEDDPVQHCGTENDRCLGEGCAGVPPYNPSCISGVVQNECGQPLAYQSISLCPTYESMLSGCLIGKTDKNGRFGIVPDKSLMNLSISFITTIPRLSPVCFYDQLCSDNVQTCEPFILPPAPTSGVEFDPYKTLPKDLLVEGDNGAKVVFPSGSKLILPIGADPFLNISYISPQELRPCFVDPQNLPLALYAMTPHDVLVITSDSTYLEPNFVPTKLDLPNTTNLPAGTIVDIYGLGAKEASTAGLEKGAWVPITTATVSEDGTRIITEEGLGYLSWFGVYTKE